MLLSPSFIGMGLKNGFDFPASAGEFAGHSAIHIQKNYF